ncbi:MAG: Enoyl-CoA hydratase/isomerase [Tardiphaga sp.]|uniref:enoyl-CoA hydratase/isomerase family protein n=1 Tax=Tardiphaga sp. TaxID=1926292 RepID=UPI0026198DB7|nr:enoyl-CoA hydratase/isomerase family protein [Tardiphaga sp.]MDB5504464.1 Enoyl-CoA hydratase/isomerase [Tardiphaga sp.]
MNTMAAATATAEPDLIVRREGSAGIIRLNRPKALNALTLEMTRGIAAALDAFEADAEVVLVLLEGAGERGLCAGGDIRGLYESARAGGDLGKVFWREEYILNARIASFPKPYVAFMDGIVMGGGVGLAAHGSHRIVTNRTKMGMPEVGIGFFPDVGGTWLLSRAPGELGTYYGLTGVTMTGADAVYARLANILIGSDDWAALRDALTQTPAGADAATVRAIMDRFAVEPTAPIAAQQAMIDASFGHDSIEEIVTALAHQSSEFAQATLGAILEKSPTGLKLTLKLLRMARQSASLEQCLIREYAAALEIFVNHDFPEGIRAAVIDKDRHPNWQPARLEQVTPEMITRYFAPRGADELTF